MFYHWNMDEYAGGSCPVAEVAHWLWMCACPLDPCWHKESFLGSPSCSQVPHCPRSLLVNVQALISTQRCFWFWHHAQADKAFLRLTAVGNTTIDANSQILQDLWVWALCFIKVLMLIIDEVFPESVKAMTTKRRSKSALLFLPSLSMYQYPYPKSAPLV